MSTPVIRLGRVEDIVASVPALLGFRPADGDLVVICLRGSRVGMCARVTLPGDSGSWDGVAAALAAAYRQDEASSALVVLYGHDALALLTVSTLLDAQRMDVREAVRVVGDLAVCQAGCSHALPTAPTVVEAAMVAHGTVIAGSRADMEGWVTWSGTATPPAPYGGLVDRLRTRLRTAEDRDAFLGELAQLSDEDLRVQLEDLLLLARVTPPWGPLRDTVLTTVAVVAYMLGNGGLANIALDEVSDHYRLANLVRQCLAATMPPAMVREALLA